MNSAVGSSDMPVKRARRLFPFIEGPHTSGENWNSIPEISRTRCDEGRDDLLYNPDKRPLPPTSPFETVRQVMPFLETSNDSRLSDHPCPIGRNWYLGGGPNRTASSLCWHIRSSFFQRGSKCIIDSDSAINLLERQAAVDCTRFFSEYRVIVTEQAIEETSIGQLTAGCVFERHALDDKL